jgi:hypothetical protein
MKTKTFFVLVSLCFATYTYAQRLHVGIQGGPLFSAVEPFQTGLTGSQSPTGGTTYDGGTGFHFTIPVAFHINRFFAIRPEFSYQRFEFHEISGAAFGNVGITYLETHSRHRLNMVHGNLLGKISTGGEKFALYLVGGPSIGAITSGNTEREEKAIYANGSNETVRSARSFEIEDSQFNSKYRGWVYGGGISIGLPYYAVQIEARKYTSTTSVYTEENLRVNAWSLNLGVSFPIR